MPPFVLIATPYLAVLLPFLAALIPCVSPLVVGAGVTHHTRPICQDEVINSQPHAWPAHGQASVISSGITSTTAA